MLELYQLNKTLPTTVHQAQRCLLHSVSLRVEAGQTVAILGASGSGKSTLLKIIAGLEPFQSGCVRFNGQDLANVPCHQRGFALIFQQFALFSHLNVQDNVSFGLIEQGMKRMTARAKSVEFLADYGLAQAAQQAVGTLSGGEQQRVALARALITRPKVLLLDEPFSALDTNLRSTMRQLFMEKIAQHNIATVLVTHDEVEARAMADQGWHLAAGELTALW